MSENHGELYLSSCLETPLGEVADLLNSAFIDYAVRIHLTSAAVASMVRADAVDLTASKMVWSGEQPIGVGLIARRGAECRLAAMAVLPQARGAGAGRWLLERLLNEAAGRGEHTMHLEVIEQNPRAVALYERCGFVRRRRLVGFVGESLAGVADERLEEVDAGEVARVLLGCTGDQVPWQASGGAIAQSALPARAFRLGDAVAAITDPDQPVIAIRSIGLLPEHRGKGSATRLMSALIDRHPGRAWRVPPIYPEDMCPSPFERAGMERDAISQFQMSMGTTLVERS
jgi:GNAT superfamily N-acetyltransferase